MRRGWVSNGAGGSGVCSPVLLRGRRVPHAGAWVLCVRRAVHVKRIATFVFYLIMVPTIMSWMPSKDQGGRELFDKGTFISGQISTLLLLTISIFTALRAPKFQVCTHGHALTPSLSRARRQAVLRLYITVA